MEVFIMYNAVGIDVSKGKSTITIIRPQGVVIRKPFDVSHSAKELRNLTDFIVSLEGETRAVCECTGRYHEPVLKAFSEANIFITAVNPKLVKGMGENTLRKIKTDPADSRKIAKYALDNWAELRQYSSMDDTREQLKALNSQYSFILKQRTAAKANLISLLDNTYPGVNKLFDSPARDDGSEKWVDYAYSFWHADCVRKIGIKAFAERYEAFCKKHHYNVRKNKAQELFEASKELVTVFPKDSTYKLLIQQQINQVNLLSGQLATIRKEMNELASTLPEYTTVMGMYGIGETYGPQLIAEVGDIRRFSQKGALVAYAGVDAPPYQSGTFDAKNRHVSKRGSPHLRKVLFEIASMILVRSNMDNPIFRFMDKKRAEGKHFYVYTVAGSAKFLRIYYAKVKEYLSAKEATA